MVKQVLYISDRLVKAGPAGAGPKMPALPKPGSAPKQPGESGGQDYTPCPLGGGDACLQAGGNGAAQHKPGGSIMRAHQEYQARAGKQNTGQTKQEQEISKDPLRANKPPEQQAAESKAVLNKLDAADQQQSDTDKKGKDLLNRLSTEHGGIKSGPTKGDIVAQKLKESTDDFLNNTDENHQMHKDTSPLAHYRTANIANKLGKKDVSDFHLKMAENKTKDFTPEQHAELANKLDEDGLHEEHSAKHKQLASSKLEQDIETKEPDVKSPDYANMDHEERKEQFIPGYKKEKYSNKLASNAKDAQKRAIEDFHTASNRYDKQIQQAKSASENYTQKLSNAIRERQEIGKDLKALGYQLSAARKKAKQTNDNSEVENLQARIDKYKEKLKDVNSKIKDIHKEAKDSKKDVEKPEFVKPSGDMEKVRHQDHTSNARSLADNIKNHLENRDDLDDETRSKLEKLHSIAEYHANIQHHPTSKNKSELKEATRLAKEHGTHTSHSEFAAEKKESDSKEKQKLESKQAKEKKVKEEETPREPSTTLERAGVDKHRSTAKKLIESFQSHLDNSQDMDENKRSMLQSAIQELGAHTNLSTVPTKEQANTLKQYSSHFNEFSKPHPNATPTEEGEVPGKSSTKQSMMSKWNSGFQSGTQLGNVYNDPYGGAGRIASMLGNYAGSGVISAGHALLSDDKKNPQQVKPTHNSSPPIQSTQQVQQEQQQKAQQAQIQQSSVGEQKKQSPKD